jgi:hypothetical protein
MKALYKATRLNSYFVIQKKILSSFPTRWAIVEVKKDGDSLPIAFTTKEKAENYICTIISNNKKGRS